jgi:hypothetical protein
MRAMLYTRVGNEFKTQVLFDTVVPRLAGFAEASAFSF